VARDRKRAKQRQQRRSQRGAPAPAHSELHRADVPGALEHASGDVDEFDAALVRGAQGVPAPLEDTLDAPETNGLAADADARALSPALAGGGDGGRGGSGGSALEPAGDGEAAHPASTSESHRQPLPLRAVAFLRASWAELQRVQWPDRRQVSQATAVVLGFVVVAGLYLGAADWVAQKIVNFIL
jgi:preprotein translocase subunit SecE